MKKTIKLLAVLMAAALFLTFGAMSAFAEASSGDALSEEEMAALLAMLGGQNATASGTDVSGGDVSGTDIFGDSINQLTAKTISEYDLVEHNYKEYGVKMLLPDYSTDCDVYSGVSELQSVLGETAGVNALFDISYSGFLNYIYYGYTDDGTSMVAMTYTESNWSRFIGNYADLSDDAQLRIQEGSDLLSAGDGSTATFRIINGVPMLCQEYYDLQYMSKYYIVQAIVDGGLYELYIQVATPTDDDLAAVEEIINSLKITGMDVQGFGTASTTTTTWLIVIVAILFVIVALMAFFLIRFSAFAKASGSSFNIIGFDLPGSDDDDDDDDDDDEDDND